MHALFYNNTLVKSNLYKAVTPDFMWINKWGDLCAGDGVVVGQRVSPAAKAKAKAKAKVHEKAYARIPTVRWLGVKADL